MKVLFITNMYPNKTQPNYGIFVKEQIEQLTKGLDSFGLINIAKWDCWFYKYGLILLKVFRCILFGRFNIIHVHFGLTAVVVIPFILLIRILGIRTVITFHGSDIVGENRFVSAISKFAARFFDLNICVSDEIQKIVSNYSKHVVKISCGITNEFFDDRAKIGRQNLIIFPSDPERKEKNYKLFKRIFDRVKQRFPDVSTDCINNLTKNEVIELMTRAKCLLITSLYEGSPQTVKEAIACDLPVVSVPVGDVPHLIKDMPGSAIGQNEDELVKAISAILESSEKYRYPNEYKKKLSNSKSCKKVLHYYNQLINT